MSFEPSVLRLRTGSSRKSRVMLCEPLEHRIALSVTADMPTQLEDIVTPLMDMPGDHGAMDPHEGHMNYPGGVMVTPTEIITPMETIPRFAANPTITTVASGNWSDPSVWSLGRVPQAGDRVLIGENQSIVYDLQSDVRIDSIEVGGTLAFSNTVNTRLLVANLTVMPTGHLQVGTAEAPIPSAVKAELVIADKPIDTVNDPRQFGTGLVALGEVTIYGAAKARTWTRLGAEAPAGSRFVWLSEPVMDWQVGDTIVFPDSRQVPTSQAGPFRYGDFENQWEEAKVLAVWGQVVMLAEPLKYDHFGARNEQGQLELLPHVAVLDRSVLIRSENPNGTRGHTLFTARADVDINFAQFRDLGRTDAFRPLDNVKFGADGQVTHVGTNQVGRYAVHLHHLLGPENPTNRGLQFRFVGNTVESSKRWGVAVHGTSFGLVDRNVVFEAQGAGFVTEDGSEIGNTFTNNIAMAVQGTHVDGKDGTATGDFGNGGVGFWFRRGGNLIVNNVAVDNTYGGFVFSGYNLTPGRLPAFRGADMHDPTQTVDGTLTPGSLFAGNEAYGLSRYGLWAAYISGNNLLENQPLTLISGLKLWNIHGKGIWTYHSSNITFDNLLILGDAKARDRNDTGPMGIDFVQYEALDMVIRNSRIEGMYLGVRTPTNDAYQPGKERPTVIENSVLKNYINIMVSPSQEGHPSSGNVLIVRNVKFDTVKDVPRGPIAPDKINPPANIRLDITGDYINYTNPSIVRVYSYNQVPGDDFQVFYHQQSADFIVPYSNHRALWTRDRMALGIPAAGLTNAQSWARYGLAVAGAVAPSNASASRPEIWGLVAPIQPTPAVPRIVMITPWENSSSPAGYARIRFNVIGQTPEGASVYFKLDDRKPVSQIADGGMFNVLPGSHTLTAYFGDAEGNIIPGLPVTVTRFRKT